MHIRKFLIIILAISLLVNVRFIWNHFRNKPIDLPYEVIKQERIKLLNTLPLSDVVFAGTSLTEGFPVHEFYKGVSNRGLGGGTSFDILQLNLGHPKKIFLEIGINDIKNDACCLFQNYRELLSKLRGSQIFIESILPVTKPFFQEPEKINSEINRANDSLKQYAVEYHCSYLNLHDAFGKEMNEKYTTDGLHLNKEGYYLWKSKIDSLVNQSP